MFSNDSSPSIPPGFDFAAQLERDVEEQVYMLAGFWLESALYGIYFVLFIGFVRHTISRRSEAQRPGRVLFLVLISTMFVLSTYWEGVNMYRFLRAYALMVAPGGLPVYYFRDFSTWDNFSYAIVSSLLFWIADFLAIYRCWVIWDKRYAIVALPSLLLVASIGTNGVNFRFFLQGFNPGELSFTTVKPLLDFVYPGHLAQNVLTTTLIAWKIWKRHMESQKAGVRVTSNITLLTVARIVVESAMIYTLQMLALVVLHFMGHPARVLFQAAIVPSIGIVFVLVTIRIQRHVKENAMKSVRTSVLFPAWVHASDLESSAGSGRGSGDRMSQEDSRRSMSMVSMLHPNVAVMRDHLGPKRGVVTSIRGIQKF